MSTDQQVTVPHPVTPGMTLTGKRVGTVSRTDSPWPWVLVRVNNATIRVPGETVDD